MQMINRNFSMRSDEGGSPCLRESSAAFAKDMVEYVYREEVRRQTVRRAIDASPSRNDGPTTTAKEATLDGHSGLAEQCYGSRLRSEEHTSELQSRRDLVCRLLLE